MDKMIIELTSESNLIEFAEVAPSKRHLGGDSKSDDKIRMEVGTRPIAKNFLDFLKIGGKEIPSDIDLYKSYKIIILPHTIGIIKEGGWNSVKQVGYRMEFENGDTSLVQDLLPQSKYIKRLGAELEVEASLSLDGNLGIPEQISKLVEKLDWIGVGGKLQLSTTAKILGNLSFSIYSTEIQAVGKNANYSEWQFNKTDLPLHGRDIEMFQILLVDRFATEINYRCKAYVNIKSFVGTSRRESEWIQIKIEL